MKNYKTIFIFIILLLTKTIVLCQSKDHQEYIVLDNNDTLFGNVNHINEKGSGRTFHKKIKLTTINGKTKKYKGENVIAFKVDKINYVSYRLDQSSDRVMLLNPKYNITIDKGEQYFLRVVTKGKLSYYELEWFEQGENTLYSMALLKKEKDQFFMRADQGLLGLKRKVLSTYLSNCPILVEAINNKRLNTVIQVVDFHNSNCVF